MLTLARLKDIGSGSGGQCSLSLSPNHLIHTSWTHSPVSMKWTQDKWTVSSTALFGYKEQDLKILKTYGPWAREDRKGGQEADWLFAICQTPAQPQFETWLIFTRPTLLWVNKRRGKGKKKGRARVVAIAREREGRGADSLFARAAYHLSLPPDHLPPEVTISPSSNCQSPPRWGGRWYCQQRSSSSQGHPSDQVVVTWCHPGAEDAGDSARVILDSSWRPVCPTGWVGRSSLDK